MGLHGIIYSIFSKHPYWSLHKKQFCFGIDAFRDIRNIKWFKVVLLEHAKEDLYWIIVQRRSRALKHLLQNKMQTL